MHVYVYILRNAEIEPQLRNIWDWSPGKANSGHFHIAPLGRYSSGLRQLRLADGMTYAPPRSRWALSGPRQIKSKYSSDWWWDRE